MVSTLNNTIEAGVVPADDADEMAKRSLPAGKQKTPPVHPGEVAKASFEELNLKPNPAAEAIGVTGPALRNVLDAKSAVSPEMALRFGKFFGNGPELWMNMQQSYDLWHAEKRMSAELNKITPAKF